MWKKNKRCRMRAAILMTGICVLIIAGCYSRLVKADFEEQFLFFADNEEAAKQMAEEYNAELLHFCSGVAVIRFQNNETPLEEGSCTYSSNERKEGLPKLFPDITYTWEMPVDEVTSNDSERDSGDSLLEQWHLEILNMEEAWKESTGKNITIAVVDSGVDSTHEDLNGALKDVLSTVPEESYGSGKWFPEEYKDNEDHIGHGTHVIGLIAARNNAFGCTGVAYDSSVISIKALENANNIGKGKSSWVASAILSAIEKDVDVINLSLGGSINKDEALYEAVKKAVNHGIIVVCAAGNINNQQAKIFYPAAYDETIAVSALGKQGDSMQFAASYSNYGDFVDFSAPGTSLMSTIVGGYGRKSGTSMSCPVLTGAVALLLQMDREQGTGELTQSQVYNILKESVTDMGNPGWDEKYGYGALDINRMLYEYKKSYGLIIETEPETESQTESVTETEQITEPEEKTSTASTKQEESSQESSSSSEEVESKEVIQEEEEVEDLELLPETEETDWVYAMQDEEAEQVAGEKQKHDQAVTNGREDMESEEPIYETVFPETTEEEEEKMDSSVFTTEEVLSQSAEEEKEISKQSTVKEYGRKKPFIYVMLVALVGCCAAVGIRKLYLKYGKEWRKNH